MNCQGKYQGQAKCLRRLSSPSSAFHQALLVHLGGFLAHFPMQLLTQILDRLGIQIGVLDGPDHMLQNHILANAISVAEILAAAEMAAAD